MDSICIDGTAHQFKINYSKIKDMSIGEHITSPAFKLGSYQWVIYCYPKGSHKIEKEGDYDFASLYLKLLENCSGYKLSFSLAIKEREGTQGTWLQRKFDHTFTNSESTWGRNCFVRRTELEDKYVTNGFLVVRCSTNMNDDSPPECFCGAFGDMRKLLETRDMADVKFEVDGEVLSAHKVILGVRSPVFKAELFGSMSETRMDCIQIKEMKPEIFKALLHFIYTYSLPNDADADMIQHLLVAADRYAIEGLIMRCEEKLIEKISLGTVLGFLTCAERHNFVQLKDACLQMVVQQKNFNELALTEEYCEMIREFPYLVKDLRRGLLAPKLMPSLGKISIYSHT